MKLSELKLLVDAAINQNGDIDVCVPGPDESDYEGTRDVYRCFVRQAGDKHIPVELWTDEDKRLVFLIY